MTRLGAAPLCAASWSRSPRHLSRPEIPAPFRDRLQQSSSVDLAAQQLISPSSCAARPSADCAPGHGNNAVRNSAIRASSPLRRAVPSPGRAWFDFFWIAAQSPCTAAFSDVPDFLRSDVLALPAARSSFLEPFQALSAASSSLSFSGFTLLPSS